VQLSSLYFRLLNDIQRYNNLSSLSFSFHSPLQEYDHFCFFLEDSIASLFPSGLSPPEKKFIPRSKQPTPWWNHASEEAVNHRQALLRIYKFSFTLDSWTVYRHESAHCRKALKKEKRLGWKLLCSEFLHKTPTAEI